MVEKRYRVLEGTAQPYEQMNIVMSMLETWLH